MVLGQALDLPEYIQMFYYEGRSKHLRTLGARNELRSASPPHRVNDAIQPSHPLLPSPLAFNLSQHQDLFQSRLFASGGQSTGASAAASVLPMNIQC